MEVEISRWSIESQASAPIHTVILSMPVSQWLERNMLDMPH